MNSFGEAFRISTFGESHGRGVGCVIDGCPAGLWIDEDFIASEMERRAPGTSPYTTSRQENDRVEILSGVFEGRSTGVPIALWIENQNHKSSSYAELASLFRPSHADWTYHHKYGIRDHRGGGRASARESVARVAAGAIAKLLLREIDVKLASGVFQVGTISSEERDFEFAHTSKIHALDPCLEDAFKQEIMNAKHHGDSIGAGVEIRAFNLPIGLGEPLYHRLDSALAGILMGLNGVKAVEIGDGIKSASKRGSEYNDCMDHKGFKSNHSGGILGGISSGDSLIVRVYFKPTPSIFIPQATLNTDYEEVSCELKGRHDPCIGVRGCVVAESLMALVIADMALLNLRSRLETFKAFYNARPIPFEGE